MGHHRPLRPGRALEPRRSAAAGGRQRGRRADSARDRGHRHDRLGAAVDPAQGPPPSGHDRRQGDDPGTGAAGARRGREADSGAAGPAAGGLQRTFRRPERGRRGVDGVSFEGLPLCPDPRAAADRRPVQLVRRTVHHHDFGSDVDDRRVGRAGRDRNAVRNHHDRDRGDLARRHRGQQRHRAARLCRAAARARHPAADGDPGHRHATVAAGAC